MSTKPITAKNGRTRGGRFAAGNQCAAGAHATHGKKLRAAILKCLDEANVVSIVHAMVEKAREGDVAAAKLLIQTIGRPEADAAEVATPAPQLKITAHNFERIKNELLARAN